MFRNRLESILNHRHALYRLSGLIDWQVFEREFGKLYSEEGRPGIPIRLLVGLTCLSHAFNTSDKETVRRWVATTNRDNFVVGMLAEPGNPYDGHTLTRAIEQAQRITGCTVQRSFVDRGYRDDAANEERTEKTQRC